MSPLAQLSSAQWAESHLSIDNLTGGWMTYQSSAATSTAWGTANRAIYVPIRVPHRITVKELGYVCNSTATGNIDIGLYDSAGTRLASTGSTAKANSTKTVALDVTDTTIGPGLYYVALNNDTTTDTFYCFSDTAPNPAARGILTQAVGAVTLPATATWALDQTLAFIPLLSALPVTELA